MNIKSQKFKAALAVIAVVSIVAVLLVISGCFGPKGTKGSKSYALTVVDDEGNSKEYEGTTDAEFLSGIMDELSAAGDFSYEGEKGEYGLYINTVNGVTADYSKDSAYWAIYVNGEYGQYGADSQPVADGDSFKLSYEKAQ